MTAEATAKAPAHAAGAGTALIVHDLKNELGTLEDQLSRLAADPDPMAAGQAHRLCMHLRQRLVMYLTLYGGTGVLRAHCDDESPAELLDAVARRHHGNDGIRVIAPADAECAAAPAWWFLDRRLVEMALDAALHNALRYARSRIWLTLQSDNGTLVLGVEDDGPGLGESLAADGNDGTRTGLGTSLCRAVADAHGPGAAVHLFNRPTHEGGARFELRLPT